MPKFSFVYLFFIGFVFCGWLATAETCAAPLSATPHEKVARLLAYHTDRTLPQGEASGLSDDNRLFLARILLGVEYGPVLPQLDVINLHSLEFWARGFVSSVLANGPASQAPPAYKELLGAIAEDLEARLVFLKFASDHAEIIYHARQTVLRSHGIDLKLREAKTGVETLSENSMNRATAVYGALGLVVSMEGFDAPYGVFLGTLPFLGFYALRALKSVGLSADIVRDARAEAVFAVEQLDLAKQEFLDGR